MECGNAAGRFALDAQSWDKNAEGLLEKYLLHCDKATAVRGAAYNSAMSCLSLVSAALRLYSMFMRRVRES
jgi:hypothetical protein